MKQSELTLEMSRYEKGSVSRINHFLKVYAFAKAIGEGEQFPSELQDILETAALVDVYKRQPDSQRKFRRKYAESGIFTAFGTWLYLCL